MSMNTRERLAVSVAIQQLEKIVRLNVLEFDDEAKTRRIIVDVCLALDMPTIAERVPERSNVVSIGDGDKRYQATIETIAREIG